MTRDDELRAPVGMLRSQAETGALTMSAQRTLMRVAADLLDNARRVRFSVEELLSMIAMVPEDMLTGLRIDPYGTIADALDALGVDRSGALDPWTALHRHLGYPDPPRTEGTR